MYILHNQLELHEDEGEIFEMKRMNERWLYTQKVLFLIGCIFKVLFIKRK